MTARELETWLVNIVTPMYRRRVFDVRWEGKKVHLMSLTPVNCWEAEEAPIVVDALLEHGLRSMAWTWAPIGDGYWNRFNSQCEADNFRINEESDERILSIWAGAE